MVHGGNLRRVVGAIIAVVLLAAVLAFNVVAGAGAGEPRCALHRDDARERAAVVTGSGDHAVVIGDSWSVGLGLEDLGTSWPSRLDARARVAGFSGSGFSEDASPCGRVSFADRAAAAVRGGADVVVVEGGLNDYDQPGEAVERGFDRLMAALAGQRVVIVGPAAAPARAGAVPRVDRLLAQLSASYGVPYVPTADLELSYLDDRLHLTEGGHAEFGDAVAERIAEVDPARPRL